MYICVHMCVSHSEHQRSEKTFGSWYSPSTMWSWGLHSGPQAWYQGSAPHWTISRAQNLLWFLLFFIFETASHVVQDGPKLLMLLPPPFKSWDYRHALSHPVYLWLGINQEFQRHASTIYLRYIPHLNAHKNTVILITNLLPNALSLSLYTIN